MAFAVSLTTSMGIVSFPVTAVSALSPMVVPDLGLSRTELGSLATVIFGMGAAFSVLGGRQVDRFGGRTVLLGVFVFGGVAVATVAGARSLAWLWLGAALAGVGQAVANPVTNALIAEHIPSGRQGLQIGVKQSGVPMTQALVGFVLPPLALVVGWRGSILSGVLLAMVGLLVGWMVVPHVHTSVARSPGATRPPLDPPVKWLTAYIFMTGIMMQAVIVYVPLYSFERVGLTPALAGMTTGVVGATGMGARILWGRVAERFAAPIRTLTVLAAVACLSVLLVLASEHVGAWALWPGLVAFGSSAMAATAVVMLAVIRGSRAGRTGRATGMVQLGLYLGFMTGPATFGALVDRTASYTVAWSVMALVCLLAMAVTILWQQSARRAPAAHGLQA